MIRRGLFPSAEIAARAARRSGREVSASPKEVADLRARSNVDEPARVIVVGAGAAGLCVAYELQRKGFEVIVLEADRGHIGGRVRTLRFDQGRYGEAGAMRIPADHDLTRFYVAETGLSLRSFVQSNDEAFLRVRGKRVRMKEGEQIRRLFHLSPSEAGLDEGELWGRAVGSLVSDLSGSEKEDLYSVEPTSWAVKQLDRLSLHGQLARYGLSAEAIQLWATTWSLETSLHIALTEHLREEIEGTWVEDFDEIEGGMDSLATAMADALKTKVRLASPVVAIEHDENGVAALVESGGSTERIERIGNATALPAGELR